MRYYKYKAVAVKRGSRGEELISFIARGPAEASYTVGEWTEANPEFVKLGYGLCCFDDPNDLRAYVLSEGIRGASVKLYECEVGRIFSPPARRIDVSEYHRRISLGRLKRILFGGWFDYKIDFPTGTLMTDKIKLIFELPR